MPRTTDQAPGKGDGFRIGPEVSEEDAEIQRDREALANEAIECECLDGLKSGPCGEEFKEAFLCFLKSGHPEKGTDCVEPYFTALKKCINQNEKALLELAPEDDPARYTGAPLPAVDPSSVKLPKFYNDKHWKPGDPEPISKDEDGDTEMSDAD